MDHFPPMTRFNSWTNDRLYASVDGLADEAYRAERGAFFGSIHGTLNHLMVVDRLWTRRIEGKPRPVQSLDQVLSDDFAALARARREEDRYLIDLVDGLDAAALETDVTYQRMIGDGEQTTRCDRIPLTLFNHRTHHRGQVHCLLTQEGTTPPPLDIVFFLEDLGLS